MPDGDPLSPAHTRPDTHGLKFPTEPVSRLRPKVKRSLRRGIQIGSPVLGTCTVFAAILLMSAGQLQVIVAGVGILILQAGVWFLSSPVPAGERRYVLLREETEHFLRLVQELNASAVGILEGVEEEKERFQATRQRMRASVNRMSELAGQAIDP